jgi:deoxyribonuclease IV
MGAIRFGPAFVPSRERPEEAVESLLQRGYSACEVDFEGGFWMDWDYAERLSGLAREAHIALSIHAPIAAFVGHVEQGKKLRMAVGMLDHTAGLARALGAAPVVFHPGFLLGRERADAIAAVVEQLGELRERLAAKARDVPFGIEVMGRVRELGSLDDVLAISAQVPWVRPVIDFAHLHAVTGGGYTDADTFANALQAADGVMEPGVPFHIHFSDISFANRNEKSHLPYGEGTLRAEPLAEALARFERPATVISEAPDEASSQAVRAILFGEPAPPAASTAPRLFEPKAYWRTASPERIIRPCPPTSRSSSATRRASWRGWGRSPARPG